MTPYDPNAYNDRTNLAKRLQTMLVEAGFGPTTIKGTREKVFSRPVEGVEGVRILVYTTIDGARVRQCGKDAIRVCAVYMAKDGRERGIASADKRVNRVGSIDAITDRTLSRMREVYKAVSRNQIERCSCGAPKFKSRKGSMVCADLCWTKQAPKVGPQNVGFTDMRSLPAPW